jgi:hypothetical protein
MADEHRSPAVPDDGDASIDADHDIDADDNIDADHDIDADDNIDADHDIDDAHDDELLRVLADALDRSEPVPDQLVAGARAALTWRTVDAELAELLYDSDRDDAPVLVRDGLGGPATRLLTFGSAPSTIDLEVDAGGDLVGVVSPPGRYVVELQAAGRVGSGPGSTAVSDGNGLFRLAHPGRGAVRLVVRASAADAPFLTTSWTVL